MKKPGDTSRGGQWIDQPGFYHFSVTEVDTQPVKKDSSELLNGTKFVLEVLAGEHDGQVGRKTDFMLWNRSGDETAEQLEKAERNEWFIAVALKLVDPNVTGEQPDPNWTDGDGRQLVAKVSKGKEGGFRIWPNDCYAVDDPEVSAVKKDTKMIKQWLGASQPTKAQQPPQQPQQQPAAAPAESGGNDWMNDL